MYLTPRFCVASPLNGSRQRKIQLGYLNYRGIWIWQVVKPRNGEYRRLVLYTVRGGQDFLYLFSRIDVIARLLAYGMNQRFVGHRITNSLTTIGLTPIFSHIVLYTVYVVRQLVFEIIGFALVAFSVSFTIADKSF
jgi:hypothetical protein